MAEFAATFALERLNDILGEKVQLLFGVRNDTIWIRNDLESMKAFIKKADRIREGDEALKAWMKQVREVAYDAEDALNKFFVEINGLQRRSRPMSGLNFARKWIVHHRFAIEIQNIQKRVQEISDAQSRYGLDVEPVEEMTPIDGWKDPRRSFSYIEEADIVGIEKPAGTGAGASNESETDIQCRLLNNLNDHAFRNRPGRRCPDELNDLANGIVRKCTGLPLAIVAMGGIISRKRMTPMEWRKVLDDPHWEVREGVAEVSRVLSLSYNWFVEDRQGKIMEDVADEYFEELLDRRMLLVGTLADDGEIFACRIHDVLREFAIPYCEGRNIRSILQWGR
ncbi:hypothetical protein AMTR_s00006p00267350 [Amborella trichopoda]|uniref:Rx N-terminal domain-containing protein n=1 Tax=Amborella trichopoda TaxID=13333 RepID=W1P7P7_AMBTC|nr:hypothetical protein AMTR_s00006p00267350 [Amborella trichopoda]